MTEETLNFPTIVTQRKVVPNVQPITKAPYRIAIIGEAPGEHEEAHGYPFVGPSGSLLNSILHSVGIDRNACLVANCVQVRPPNNDIARFSRDGTEFQNGLAALRDDLESFNPHLCLLLGTTPLHSARENGKITAWRGSLFRGLRSGTPFFGRKCLPSLHPAGVLRDFSGYPLLQFDCRRAREEGETPILTLPERQLITNASPADLCHLLDSWPAGLRCSIDIEGYHDNWPCVSVCASPWKSWTIAWGRFGVADHARVLQSFARLMQRTDVPKVLQNQLSDNFKLCWGFGIHIRNVTEDTMIKGWEIYAELPRALETQASIWTRQPHWKDDSMYKGDGEGLFRGCAVDTAVTLEICEAQDRVLSPASKKHYDTMIALENPFLYMQLRGIKYNAEAAKTKRDETEKTLNEIKERLGREAGKDLWGPKGSLSSKKLCEALYTTGKYPPQYAKEDGKKTESLTSGVEALLSLKRSRPDDTFLSDILSHRHHEGVRETLSVKANDDGRVRCAYSLEAETGRVKCYTSDAGSGTNLQTVQKALRGNYIADSGHDFCQCDLEGADGWTYAAHAARLGDPTMIEDYRAGMKPAKIIGLQYWFGGPVNRIPRSELKWTHDNLFPVVKKLAGEWVYLGCKRVQHGGSYKMGIPTMQWNVLHDSFKESGTPLYMPHADAAFLRDACFFGRYPGILLWHRWAESKLMADARLTSASGHTRIFFGRRFGDRGVEETIKQFLAHEPQNNTTWATNLAMLNLWRDPANRVRHVIGRIITCCDGSEHYIPLEALPYVSRLRPAALLIEPLHQVHDALCVQWLSFMREWAQKKMHQYFQNELSIAGTLIIIPFDGTWGPSWGEMPERLAA